jgi:hypothetical protein
MLVMTMVSMGGAEQLAERIQSQRELFARIAPPPNLTVRSSRNPRSRGAFFAFSRHSTCPGYLRDPFLSESYMLRVRTNFPLCLFSFRAECIVVGRVDFVTFCLQKYARIPSREIVPTGRIFPHFLPSHRRSPPSLSVAFVRISGNGKVLALRDLTGTISREAAMFFATRLSACVTGWTTCASDLLWRGGSWQWEYDASAYCCALAR